MTQETFHAKTDLGPPQRLRASRLKRGFSSAEKAARAFGWKASTYRAHENGQNRLSKKTAERYAAAFQVPPDWLLFGVDHEEHATGVAEGAEPFSDRDAKQSPEDETEKFRLSIGPDGKLALPPALMKRYGLEADDVLIVLAGDYGMVVEPLKLRFQRAQALVRQFVPEDVSLADELIAERREEARRE